MLDFYSELQKEDQQRPTIGNQSDILPNEIQNEFTGENFEEDDDDFDIFAESE